MDIPGLITRAKVAGISKDDLDAAEALTSELDPVDDLLTLPMGEYFDKLEKSGEFGKLPTMARCYVGANLSEGFCERIISAGNLAMDEGNTLLSHDHLKKLVLLRVNRDFMIYMRTHQKHVLQQICLVSQGDCVGALRSTSECHCHLTTASGHACSTH
jgi:hypothetical protein